jgi:hypothetical protein
MDYADLTTVVPVYSNGIPATISDLTALDPCGDTDTDPATNNWDPTSCRIVIDYVRNIQPLWEKSRTYDLDGDGNADDIDGDGNADDHQCTGCHTETLNNAANVPDGQLSLDVTGAHQVLNDSMRHNSYLELTDNDTTQVINAMGELEYIRVPDLSTPDDLTDTRTVPLGECATNADVQASLMVSYPLTYQNKCGSGTGLFAKMTSGDVNDIHSMMLNDAEKRLLAEWYDNGRRYANDPAPPAN